MTNSYPLNIINDFRSDKIDKSSAIDKLFSFLLKSDDHKKKKKIIDVLLEIYRNLRDNENNEFEPRIINLFKHVIQNERYIYVVQHINGSIERMNKTFQDIVVNEIIKKYVLFYDVVPEEVKFMSLDTKTMYVSLPSKKFNLILIAALP